MTFVLYPCCDPLMYAAESEIDDITFCNVMPSSANLPVTATLTVEAFTVVISNEAYRWVTLPS